MQYLLKLKLKQRLFSQRIPVFSTLTSLHTWNTYTPCFIMTTYSASIPQPRHYNTILAKEKHHYVSAVSIKVVCIFLGGNSGGCTLNVGHSPVISMWVNCFYDFVKRKPFCVCFASTLALRSRELLRERVSCIFLKSTAFVSTLININVL